MSNQPPRNYWDDISRFWSGLRLGDRFRAAARFPYQTFQQSAARLRAAYGVPNVTYRAGWSGGWPELTTSTPVQYRGPGSSYRPRAAPAPRTPAYAGGGLPPWTQQTTQARYFQQQAGYAPTYTARAPVYLPQQAYMTPDQWSGRPYTQPTPQGVPTPTGRAAGGPFYYLQQGRAGPQRPWTEDKEQLAYERWAAKVKAYGSQAFTLPQEQPTQPAGGGGGYYGGGYGYRRGGGYGGGGRAAYTPTTYTPREQAYRVATQLPPSPDIPGWLYQLVTWQI